MFCSNRITLAFRWRLWVNNRDTTAVSVASAIKSSRMMMLLSRGLIPHRFSDSSGTPLSNRTLFPRDFLFQLFVTSLPLIVVPRISNTLLLFIHDTIIFQNLLDKLGFSTLCETYNQKSEFMAKVELRIGFGGQRLCRSRCCS